ncbi:ABC transporter ATP-binding protein [Nitratireductor aquibiodomus]|jgi:peptide/nickel transport system ATP-binding protein|uniref:Oligopeptide/dipeptide transporter, C-terminal region n=1 Tax=Nitratireductor aquibiodomus TaxID=204799 RepID=A0A1H4Q2E9_9HYPH|nr:ABC transporter ATP-binding protein [Nitratireductor aquibiodomus]SEC13835.1 Oligopeptide/dipeptide transporter, C-terminal region [Nitratireductor aquibiodomus]
MSLISLDNVAFGYSRKQQVLHDVSFNLRSGVNVGLVGESGSGKSTILKLLLGLARPTGGRIQFGDAELNPGDRAFMRDYRRAVQAVFQDPYSSLDPRQKVQSIIAEPLRALRIPGSHQEAVEKAIHDVGLPVDAIDRYPHEFSGGQRQRIAIARAIVARPQLILADEAVSALDLSTRARIVDLLKALSEEMTILLVSHDLAVVAALCEEIVILEKGKVVESGRTADILANPAHPYTQKLLASVPRMPA